MHFIDIIILLALVFVIYSKLKSVLGTKPEVSNPEAKSTKNSNVFELLIKEVETNASTVINKGEITPVIDMDSLSELDKALLSIPNFNKEKFLNNAKKAFEIILTAFSQNDTETLKDLVSTPLYKKFEAVINERKSDNITAEMEFIGFQVADIEDAKVLKNAAKICVKFVSEQVNILKNAKDEVIEGDANFIQNITDIWTFERPLSSTSPKWLLASTKK